jgi:hypothetical protein
MKLMADLTIDGIGEVSRRWFPDNGKTGAYGILRLGQPLRGVDVYLHTAAEIDAVIADRIANYRLVPTDIFMSATDQQALGSIVLTGNTNLAPFFMGGMSEGGLQASTTLKRYINPIGFGNPYLDVHAHPFIPAGTIIFYSKTNPYPLSNVPNLLRKLLRRDYWSVEWPVVTRQYTYGVYFDGFDETDAAGREHGTNWLMDKLGASLEGTAMPELQAIAPKP